MAKPKTQREFERMEAEFDKFVQELPISESQLFTLVAVHQGCINALLAERKASLDKMNAKLDAALAKLAA